MCPIDAPINVALRLIAGMSRPAHIANTWYSSHLERRHVEWWPHSGRPLRSCPLLDERLSLLLSSRLEESEMRLETSHQVNVHLNAEVETLTKQLDKLREQNESYQRHMHDLAAMLAQERRHHASGTDQVAARPWCVLEGLQEVPWGQCQLAGSKEVEEPRNHASGTDPVTAGAMG